MQLYNILLTFALGYLTAASNIDGLNLGDLGQIAEACSSTCSPVVTAGVQCYDDSNNDEDATLDCLCNANGMDVDLPQCEACVTPYINNHDVVDELTELRNYCGFSAASASNSTVSGTSVVPNAADATSTASISVVQQNAAVITAAPIIGMGAGIAMAALAGI